MPLAFSMDDSRRYERDAVECPAQIWGGTLPPSPAVLINMSPSGCMIRCDQMVSIGESLTIDVAQIGTLRGRAIWAAGARLGVEFEMAIPEKEYEVMLAKLKGPGDFGR
ncbi:MAG: PilZ domain-containing protein [Alphaproteobacteria bacterium]|jgi:PilZ domain.|nr:PilZ domain-containing protein [Alphaproteobacteria bacterium]MBU0877321.1 PilZ domain-containing protein [Alphaproteobacteria bacterium]MBU1770503.1 PilZ domain-containing protein [Alphaproteobacteria bacterium]